MSETEVHDQMEEVHDRGPTAVEGRIIDAHCKILQGPPKDLAFNHSAFAQVALPYRCQDPETFLLRRNGSVSVAWRAGVLVAPDGTPEPLGLPYGTRARLVLIHLMTQACVKRDPHVDLGDSLTAFVKRILGEKAAAGRNIRTLRDQMRRLSACSVQISMPSPVPGVAVEQFQSHIVTRLQLYSPAEPGQRVFWPSYVRLSDEFFSNLQEHAVPLRPEALEALAHSSAALDTYQWLAQRLCRVGRYGAVVPWSSLHQQLGASQKHTKSWKQSFLGERARSNKKARIGTLQQVLAVYPEAKDAVDWTKPDGLHLKQAAPPVRRWKDLA